MVANLVHLIFLEYSDKKYYLCEEFSFRLCEGSVCVVSTQTVRSASIH